MHDLFFYEYNLENYLSSQGSCLTFYLPIEKIDLVRNELHVYLIENFGGYTTEKSEITGYWREHTNAPVMEDVNIKYVVSYEYKNRAACLAAFLSSICTKIEEKSIWLMIESKVYFVKPS